MTLVLPLLKENKASFQIIQLAKYFWIAICHCRGGFLSNVILSKYLNEDIQVFCFHWVSPAALKPWMWNKSITSTLRVTPEETFKKKKKGKNPHHHLHYFWVLSCKVLKTLIFLSHMQHGADAEYHPKLEVWPQLLCKISRTNVNNTERTPCR